MPKILAIDDDASLLGTIVDWLAYEENEVDSARTGGQGWQMMQLQKHDLIILDWDLPDINGIDLLKRFRKVGGTVPVIMLTGRSSIDDKTAALDAGADDYMVKPFHVKELSSRIKAVLKRSNHKAALPLGAENKEILERGDLIGTNLAARYEFLEIIGSGSMGVVFKARHPHLQKLYAIKMIHSNERSDDIACRFEQEARLISGLEHPNIAAIHDFGITEKDRQFMVLDYIDGINLSKALGDKGPIKPLESLYIASQIADAMAYAHKANIIHRDLKPTNIMLKQDDDQLKVKVLDFGCAKIRKKQTKDELLRTNSGMVVGTPVYMSPEQACGEEIDQRTDIYALGCILFEMLTGQMPHIGSDTMEVMAKHVHEVAPELREKKEDLEAFPDLQVILNKAMAKTAEARYQTMTEFKEAIEGVRQRLQGNSSRQRINFWQMLRQNIMSPAKRNSSQK